jgi:1-acyl-sn-glycerol-3-phosphate acyltransferase
MRTVLVVISTLFATLALAPVVVVARLMGRPDGENSIYDRCMHAWARSVIRAAGCRVRIHGDEHLVPGAVYISNHVSWFDIFALAAELPRYTFIAKREIRRIPVFGWGAEAAGIVFLDRGNRKQAFAAYETAAVGVREGRNVVVCPEGTRGYDYHLRPFKKGPFVLAIASQRPIVPTIVHGTIEIMPKGSFWITPGTIDVRLLEPVPTAGYDYDHRSELMTVVWNRMADALRTEYGVGTSEAAVEDETASDELQSQP